MYGENQKNDGIQNFWVKKSDRVHWYAGTLPGFAKKQKDG